MRAVDRPVLDRRAAEARNPHADRRRDIIDGDGGGPPGKLRRATRACTCDPEDAGQDEPGRDALEVAEIALVMLMQRPQHEDGATGLHEDIGRREGHRTFAEGLRDRRGEHQSRRHQDEQHQPYGWKLGIEPVRDPGGVNPHPPHRHHEQAGLHRAENGQMSEQAMGKLGDGEDEHEIEEQLDVRDAGVLVAIARTQQVPGRRDHESSVRIRRSGSFGSMMGNTMRWAVISGDGYFPAPFFLRFFNGNRCSAPAAPPCRRPAASDGRAGAGPPDRPG